MVFLYKHEIYNYEDQEDKITYPILDPANDASNVKLFFINISFHITTRPVDSLHRWI
jgi:hypothetical protein